MENSILIIKQNKIKPKPFKTSYKLLPLKKKKKQLS